jgi:hypothetical protein
MSIVRPTLKIDVLKMKQAFFTGYLEGEKAFYVSSKNPKVKKSLSVNTCLLGALFGPTRTPNLRNYCYKIQIFLSYVERCSMFGMGIIAFKHGNPTLI